MTTSRDKFGLLLAVALVAFMVWYGLSHYSHPGASGRTGPSPAQVAQRQATVGYLRHLLRIDSPVEATERSVGHRLLHEIAKPGSITPAAKQEASSIANAYTRAASQVRHIQPPTGFGQAQRLLAKTYADQSTIYRSTRALAILEATHSDPADALHDLTRIDKALKAFDKDLTACRAAFQTASATAGVTTPGWLAALINHATGQSA